MGRLVLIKKCNLKWCKIITGDFNGWIKKKYLPVIILDKLETWRKISDFESNSGWIHISQLSRKKSAINIKKNSILYKKSTIYSKPIAKLEIGRLVLIKKCKIEWCKISSGNYIGWVFKNTLWGKI